MLCPFPRGALPAVSGGAPYLARARSNNQSKRNCMGFQADLEKLLGLKTVTYKYNLSKEELFHEAIKNDRGRVKRDGPNNAQKAFATRLGAKGPLVYYTDP